MRGSIPLRLIRCSLMAASSPLEAADLYAARPADKPAAAATPALVAAVSSARAASDVHCRRLAEPLHGAVLRGVLSEPECCALRAEAAALGYSFWAPERTQAASVFRSADTVEVECPQLAAALWARLSPHVPPRLELGDGTAADGAVERGLSGVWEACGVNATLLFSRYGAGGHFSPHTDGNTVVDLNQRSLYSVIVYLNSCGDGGGTTLFAPPDGDACRLFQRDSASRLRWPPEWAVDAAVRARAPRCGARSRACRSARRAACWSSAKMRRTRASPSAPAARSSSSART